MRSLAPFAASLALSAVFYGVALSTGIVEAQELRSQDLRTRLLPPLRPHNKVVVVGIGDREEEDWTEPEAFWTARAGGILDGLLTLDPRWIGLDVAFRSDVDAYFERNGLPNPRAVQKLQRAMFRQKGRLTLAWFRGLESINRLKVIARHEENLGFADIVPDADRVVRSMPVGRFTANGYEPSFSSAVATRAKGLDPNGPREAVPRLGPSERFGINGRLPEPRVISAADVLNGSLSRQEREALRNAIVLIGSTQRVGSDQFMMPSGRRTPGVIVQAMGVSTAVEGLELRRVPMAGQWVLLATMVLLLALIPFGFGVPAALVCGAGWFAFATWAIDRAHLVLPVAAPLIAAGSALLGVYVVRFVLDSRRRRRIESVFGANVSPQIRNMLLEDPRWLELGGRSGVASVLFVDMRDSVDRAMRIGAERMMMDLNALFERIVPAVQNNNGIVNRFTGDGFVALFGVPADGSNHAESAVRAAREILHSVRDLNRSGERLPIRVGCGVNTGHVMFGNVGTSSRYEFTIIGETVNTAARIESHTKETTFDLLIGEQTFRHLERCDGIGGPIAAALKGMKEPVVLYPVLIEPGGAP